MSTLTTLGFAFATMVLQTPIPSASVAAPPGPAPMSGQAPSAPGSTLLVLPVTVPGDASADVQQLAATLERSLARSLNRQGTFTVMRMEEVKARLGEMAAQQLKGCDESSCLAQLAEALGTDRMLHTRLETAPGTWTLRLSLIHRLKAGVELRREVRARSVDGLLSSSETLARELSGGGRLVGEDPQLPQRLGTTVAAAQTLREHLATHAGVDPVQAWTDQVIGSNQESGLLALAEGGLVLASGLSLVLMGPPISVFSALSNRVRAAQAPWWLGGPKDNTHGPYVMPFTFPLMSAIASVLFFSSSIPLVLAAVLGVVDWFDIGRVSVARDGCCRDEARIRKAAKPGWAQRLAPILSIAGGALALTFPLTSIVGSYVIEIPIILFLGQWPPPALPGPSLGNREYSAVYLALLAFQTIGFVGIFITGFGALAAALLMVAHEHSPVVDSE